MKVVYSRFLISVLIFLIAVQPVWSAPQITFLPEVDGSPATFNYACNPGIEMAQLFGRIVNTGDSDLVISSIEFSGEDISSFSLSAPIDFPLTVPAGEGYDQEVRIMCNPASLNGPLEANLNIISNDSAVPELIVPFQAAIELRPNLEISINFLKGKFLDDGSKRLRLKVVIANTGLVDVTVPFTLRIKISGPNGFRLRKNVRLTGGLEAQSILRKKIFITGLPENLSRYIRGTSIDAIGAEYSGTYLLDSKNEVLESNEAEDTGETIDQDSADNSSDFYLK